MKKYLFKLICKRIKIKKMEKNKKSLKRLYYFIIIFYKMSSEKESLEDILENDVISDLIKIDQYRKSSFDIEIPLHSPKSIFKF